MDSIEIFRYQKKRAKKKERKESWKKYRKESYDP